MPGLGDAVDERRGAEERRFSESPEGGAAGGAGLPPCRPKEEMAGGTDRRTEKRRDGDRKGTCPACEARGRGEPGQRTGTACGARVGGDDGGRTGRLRALGGRRNTPVALSSEEGRRVRGPGVRGWREAMANACEEKGARSLREQALPNVWHQRRAKRVRCMPGLGPALPDLDGGGNGEPYGDGTAVEGGRAVAPLRDRFAKSTLY